MSGTGAATTIGSLGSLNINGSSVTLTTRTLNNQGTVVGRAVFQLQRPNSATAGVNNPTDPLLTGAIDLSYWR